MISDELNKKRIRFLEFLKSIYPGIIWVDINKAGHFHLVDAEGEAFWDMDSGEGLSHKIPRSWEDIPCPGFGNISDGLQQFVHWYNYDDNDLYQYREEVLKGSKFTVGWFCNSYPRSFEIDRYFTEFINNKEIFGLVGCSRITQNKDKVTCPRCRKYIEEGKK